MKLLLLITPLIIAAQAHAQSTTVEGILKTLSGVKFLQLKNSQILPLHPGNEQTSQELDRIQEGDFLFGIGNVDFSARKVHLYSIEKVGLKKLLGSWRSDQGGIFAFKSFSQVVLFEQQLQPHSINDAALPGHRLRYHVSPSTGSSWSIFLVGRNEVLVGRFRFFGDRLKMYFIDESSGTITQRLTLTKLHPLNP
jgi:hypothetical protein